jgi:hypothetical protein
MSNKKRIDDRAALVLMADIIAWEGVPVRAAAFRALPASEQAKLASPEPLKEVYRKGIENRATRLQREYAKNRHALERLARIRKARMLRRHRKTHGVGAGVFGKTTSPTPPHLETILGGPAIKRYEAKIAKLDSSDIEHVADMVSMWADWAKDARSPADAKARRLLLADHLEGFAKLLRAEAPDIARLKTYDLIRQFRPE